MVGGAGAAPALLLLLGVVVHGAVDLCRPRSERQILSESPAPVGDRCPLSKEAAGATLSRLSECAEGQTRRNNRCFVDEIVRAVRAEPGVPVARDKVTDLVLGDVLGDFLGYDKADGSVGEDREQCLGRLPSKAGGAATLLDTFDAAYKGAQYLWPAEYMSHRMRGVLGRRSLCAGNGGSAGGGGTTSRVAPFHCSFASQRAVLLPGNGEAGDSDKPWRPLDLQDCDAACRKQYAGMAGNAAEDGGDSDLEWNPVLLGALARNSGAAAAGGRKLKHPFLGGAVNKDLYVVSPCEAAAGQAYGDVGTWACTEELRASAAGAASAFLRDIVSGTSSLAFASFLASGSRTPLGAALEDVAGRAVMAMG